MQHWRKQAGIDGRVIAVSLDEFLTDKSRESFLLSLAQRALARSERLGHWTGELFVNLLAGDLTTTVSGPINYLDDKISAYEQHAAECEYCRTAREIYRYKRDVIKVMSKWERGKEIIAQAANDSRILKRDLGNGTTAYFRPNHGQTNGTTVVVASSGDFLSIEEQSRDAFQNLKPT